MKNSSAQKYIIYEFYKCNLGGGSLGSLFNSFIRRRGTNKKLISGADEHQQRKQFDGDISAAGGCRRQAQLTFPLLATISIFFFFSKYIQSAQFTFLTPSCNKTLVLPDDLNNEIFSDLLNTVNSFLTCWSYKRKVVDANRVIDT